MIFLAFHVSGVSIFKGFGFVQFENEADANAAIAAENHSLLKGCNLGECHVRFSSPEVISVYQFSLLCPYGDIQVRNQRPANIR